MLTAQIPYLNNVKKARVPTILQRLLFKKQYNVKHKNNEAVGLSGTNGKKYYVVEDNCSAYQ